MKISPTRDILTVLCVKAVALALIYAFFFSPAHRPANDSLSVAHALLSERTQ